MRRAQEVSQVNNAHGEARDPPAEHERSASGAWRGPRSARLPSGNDLDVGDRVAQRSDGHGCDDGEPGEGAAGESVTREGSEHGVILRCYGAKVRRRIGRANGRNRTTLFRLPEQLLGAQEVLGWGGSVVRKCENQPNSIESG